MQTAISSLATVESFVMQSKLSVITIGMVLFLAQQSQCASIFESLGLKKGSRPAEEISISEQQIAAGLKEALNQGIHTAVAQLGREGGFLNDPKVRIPMPENLRKVEKTLRKLRQDRIADEFVTTMNRAAEKAVPEAAGVLVDSVKQMTLADAKSILTGPDTAATDYFRRTSHTNLYERLLPIVKTATERTGVTSAYKAMLSKTNVGGFGNLGATLLGQESVDLDDYITRKSLDGLFAKIAEQEKLIRANPAARTTELLQQVFGSIKK